MALERVPPYLIDGVNIARSERVLAMLQNDDDEAIADSLVAAVDVLSEWDRDADFWRSADEQLRAAVATDDFDELLDEERGIVADALGGDHRLVDEILLETPGRLSEPDLDRARTVVVVLIRQSQEVLEVPANRGSKWRAAKVLRRVFKATAGGILVAADIIAPEPTLIVKVASVTGGIDMIVDAVAPQ